MTRTLADYMRESDTDLFLLEGPPCPRVGWIYRDFRKMPQADWLKLMEIIGEDNMMVVGSNSSQTPPAEMCRAQLWISPKAQKSWAAYLEENPAESTDTPTA